MHPNFTTSPTILIKPRETTYIEDHMSPEEVHHILDNTTVVLIFQLRPPTSPSASPSISPVGSPTGMNAAVPFIFNITYKNMVREVSSFMTYHLDDHNRIYIGRDPGMFSTILGYLNTGELDVQDLDEEEKQRLKEDILFFQMKELKHYSIEKGLLSWSDEEESLLPFSPAVTARRKHRSTSQFNI
eukprot:TRINITY_DN55_c0_g1_i6.p1 TRINITY_DN55_c0_g1~~TRINITY_DN55_c0_g1_i6.p1  ORF type:complete len:186 (-),score=68.20 TRINITY_DN55_c0_g1_i6:123-680(-)